MLEPLNVFISYSHKDTALKSLFETHLLGLARSIAMNIWSDNKIVPGTEWHQDIFTQLEKSQLVFLLISPDFVASEFCFRKELNVAMENHERKKSMVLPIFLRPGNYDNLVFTKVQTLPDPEPLRMERPRTIVEWSNPDAALQNVMMGVQKAVNLFLQQYQLMNPVARKEEIEQYLMVGDHEKASNRLMDFINDFSTNKMLDMQKMISFKSSLYTINTMLKNKEAATGERIELKEILEARESLTMNFLGILYGIMLPQAA